MNFDSATDQLLTASEVATILRVRPKEVYDLPLPAVRLSARRLRWTRSTVEQFVANRSERR